MELMTYFLIATGFMRLHRWVTMSVKRTPTQWPSCWNNFINGSAGRKPASLRHLEKVLKGDSSVTNISSIHLYYAADGSSFGEAVLIFDTARMLQFRKLKVVGNEGFQTNRKIVHSPKEAATVEVWSYRCDKLWAKVSDIPLFWIVTVLSPQPGGV